MLVRTPTWVDELQAVAGTKEPSLRHSRLLLPLASKGCNYAPCKTRYVGQHSCMYYLTYTIDVIHVRRGSRIQKGGGPYIQKGGGGGVRTGMSRTDPNCCRALGKSTSKKEIADSRGGGGGGGPITPQKTLYPAWRFS